MILMGLDFNYTLRKGEKSVFGENFRTIIINKIGWGVGGWRQINNFK